MEGTMYVYLSGPIEGCSYEEATQPREWAKRLLKGFAVCLDPARNIVPSNLNAEASKRVVETDKQDITVSDVVLVIMNGEKRMYGTMMEIIEGWNLKKLVVVVGPNDLTSHPWIQYHASARFERIETAVFYIKEWWSQR